MDDLNIRAAKALGWDVWDGKVFIPLGISQKFGIDLKFTTSYDWARLGIEFLDREEADLENWESFLNKFGDDLNFFFTRSIAEITQAWVEVLENVQ